MESSVCLTMVFIAWKAAIVTSSVKPVAHVIQTFTEVGATFTACAL